MTYAISSRGRLKVRVLHLDAAVVGEPASVELVQILLGKVNRLLQGSSKRRVLDFHARVQLC